MQVQLPDGKQMVLEGGSSALDLAKAISPGLAKAAVAAEVNDQAVDITRTLNEGDTVRILTFDSEKGRSIFHHSSSHILAQAVQELFPEAKIAIGPAIENGFYYDFEMPRPFTPEDIVAVEEKCKEIVKRKLQVHRVEMSAEEIRRYFSEKGEKYKLELLENVEGTASMYQQGEWRDLCRGPHIPNTGMVKAFKIMSSAGAYWRGDEHNPMLQRLYAVSFPKQSLLDEYLRLLEEAQKRDHRKLGRELDLFSFHAEGTGFPFWHPKGMLVYNEVMDFSRAEHLAGGYQEIRTPIILHEELWRQSGHWDKYRENMYFTSIDDIEHAVKPMNCPGGLLVYKSASHSYREFPIKNFEFGLVHRHEKAGVLHGLFRVRQFTQDDAHIFCLPDQVEQQVGEVFDFIIKMYSVFGFNDYHIELSTRPEDSIGAVEMWDTAENALKSVLENKNIDYQLNEGDGAFYGPKIDFHIRDCLNRSWQCGTIQLDFSMPERFELEYTDSDGQKKRPVMIHRALFGSMERFIGIMIEHYGGFLPLWLSPVQVKVLPISDKHLEYARKTVQELRVKGFRAELDDRAEKVGYKIRDAEVKKIPYMVIIGEKEQATGTVSVRKHTRGDLGAFQISDFYEMLRKEIESRSVEPA